MNLEEKIRRLTDLGIELNQVHDLDILMERILSNARSFVNADAGSIYINEGTRLKFSYTQNATLQNREGSGKKLIYSTFSIPVNKKSLAGYVATTGRLLNIPDVYDIEEEKPYTFSDVFDKASNYQTKSILTLPLKNAQKKNIGILQIINAKDIDNNIISFSTEDEEFMRHFASIASVALQRARMTRSMILRMVKMAELRDPKETGAHVNRVAAYSVELYERWAKKHGLSSEQINREKDILSLAAMLHDVGKIATSDLILKKPGRLTDEEFSIMKNHTLQGAHLFTEWESDYDKAAAQVAFTHHERWDGNGYPGHVDMMTGKPDPKFINNDGSVPGKKGEEIPLFGRIVALADVFDALSSTRSYKTAWSEEAVLSEIQKSSGTHFDPELVDIFVEAIDVIRSIKERYQENN